MAELCGNVCDRRVAREEQAREGVPQVIDPEDGQADAPEHSAEDPGPDSYPRRVVVALRAFLPSQARAFMGRTLFFERPC